MITWRIFQGIFIVLDVIDTYQTIKALNMGMTDKNWIINKLKKPLPIIMFSVVMLCAVIGLTEIFRALNIIVGWVFLTGWVCLKVYCVVHNWEVLKR